MAAIDQAAVQDELSTEWLEGLDGEELEEGRRLLGEVVAEWAREADSTPDPEAVLAIQRRSLDERGQGLDAADRLDVLRSRVAERKVDRLSVEAYALGKSVLDGSADDEQARADGKALLARAEALAADLDAIGTPADAPVRRDLGDAMLDALYAVERKAMSMRLAREAPGAPSVS